MALAGCKTTEELIKQNPDLGLKINHLKKQKELEENNQLIEENSAQVEAEEKFLSNQTVMIKPIHTKVRPITEDIALTASVSRYEKTGDIEPVMMADQMILFPYGLSKPKLVCGVLRVCSISLQEGEQILDVVTGDSQRWNITIAHKGIGQNEKPVLMIKPLTQESIKTNLIITTDQRIYEIELGTVTNSQYTPRIGFFYPQEIRAAKYSRNSRNEEDLIVATTAVSIEDMNFNYKIKGSKRKAWYPKRVFDDGKKVYIQMSPKLSSDEVPVFMVLGDHGKTEIVNYRYKNGYFIVDKLFDKSVLILGTDKKRTMIKIIKKGSPRE